MTTATTTSKGRSPSTVGHPHRDPETGLVPQSQAYDLRYGDGETDFGDGKSIVDFTADVSEFSPSLHVVVWVRPTERHAPLDSIGRPMPGYLAQGASACYDLTDPTAIATAIAWLTKMGLTPSYVSKGIERSMSLNDEAHAQTARCAGLLAELGDMDLVDSLLDQAIADAASAKSADVRARLAKFASEYPSDMACLRRQLSAATS